LAQSRHRVRTEAAALEPLDIDIAGLGWIAGHQHIRGYVLGNVSGGAQKGMGADLAELVDQGIAAEDGPVAHIDVAGKRRVIGEDAAIAYRGIVPHMHIGHEQVVVADGGLATILDGAAMNRHAFANHIVIADHQARGLALVLQVGRVFAAGGGLQDLIVAADVGGALHHHVRGDACAGADLDLRADRCPRADLDIGGKARGWIDDGRWMDHGGRLDMGIRARTGNSVRRARSLHGSKCGFEPAAGHGVAGSGVSDWLDFSIGTENRAGSGELFTDEGAARELPDTALIGNVLGLEDQLIARYYAALEARVVDADEIVDRAVSGFLALALETENAGGLRHGFDDQYTGHYRYGREMAIEIRLVDGDIFNGNDRLRQIQFDNAIDKQKRVAMRQVLANFIHFHHGLGPFTFQCFVIF